MLDESRDSVGKQLEPELIILGSNFDKIHFTKLKR